MIPIPKLFLETDATQAVLDFTEVQAHLRLDGTTDQVLVESLISGVTKKIEAIIGRKLTAQVWSIYFDFWPCSPKQDAYWDGTRDGAISELYAPVRELELPFGPCQSLSFIHAIDQTDGTTNFDSSMFSVDTISPIPIIALKVGATWPAILLRSVNGIHIKGTFGMYSVPEDIKQAVRLSVAKMYENRGDNPSGEFFGFSSFALPPTAQYLLEPYRRIRI